LRNTSFLQTQTILNALEFALRKGGFKYDPQQKKTAAALVREMKGTRSVSGRQQQLMAMLERGATIDQMIAGTRSSRRTIFRYLNHFEDAGIDIVILDGKYRLKHDQLGR